MVQTLRVDDIDSRIEYGPQGAWQAIKGSGESWNKDGIYHTSSEDGSRFFFIFRGTKISIYGHSGSGGGTIDFRMDTERKCVDVNGTEFADGTTPIFVADNLPDADHQVFGIVNALTGQTANVWIDYFELENSSGNGFDPSRTGANAKDVPQEAVIIDNSNNDIILSNPSQWSTARDLQFYGETLLYSTTPGASISYTFEGVAIWYYSDADIPHGFYTVSIDGSEPERFSSYNPLGQISRQMLWSKTDLSPGTHTITLTQDDADGKYITLDYFRVLHNEDAAALQSSTSATTSTAPHTTDSTSSSSTNNRSRTLGLVIGIPVGFVLLALLMLSILVYMRKQRRRSKPDLGFGGLSPQEAPREAPREAAREIPQEMSGKLLRLAPPVSFPAYRKPPVPVWASQNGGSSRVAAGAIVDVGAALVSPVTSNWGLPPTYADHEIDQRHS